MPRARETDYPRMRESVTPESLHAKWFETWRDIRKLKERYRDDVPLALEIQAKVVEEVCTDFGRLLGKGPCAQCEAGYTRNKACRHLITPE